MKNEEKKVEEIKKENSGTALTEEELKMVTGGNLKKIADEGKDPGGSCD